jgi:hypothetical protein
MKQEQEFKMSNAWFMPHVIFNKVHAHIHKNRSDIKEYHIYPKSEKLNKAFKKGTPLKKK